MKNVAYNSVVFALKGDMQWFFTKLTKK